MHGSQPIPSITPEATAVSCRRYFAHLIDSLLFLIPLIIVLSVGFAISDLAGIAAAVLALTIGTVAFYVLIHGKSGQSPGKRVTGIRVVGHDGQPPSRDALIKRSIPLIVEYFQWLAWISMMSSAHRQRLGDRWAATYVVRAR